MKKYLAVISLLTASWSLNAAAASHSVVCNGCTSAETTSLVQGSAAGDYFVYDMVNRQITHYAITKGVDIDHQIMTNVAITPAVQTQFNYVQQFYDATGSLNVTVTFTISGAAAATKKALVNPVHTSAFYSVAPMTTSPSPIGAPSSAFDLVNTPANQEAAITAMLNSGSKWGQATTIVEAALASFASHFTPAQVLYPVPVIITSVYNFPDGTTCQFIWDVNLNQWIYTPGSGRDQVGNPIPENPDQAVGGALNRQNYVFPNTANGVLAAYAASQNFSNIGLPVGTPVFTSRSAWTVACVRVGGTNGTISCNVVYQGN